MRLRCSILSALLLLPLAAFAQGAYAPVQLFINSTDGVYARGDSIRITASVSPEAEDTLLFQLLTYGQVTCKKKLPRPQGDTLLYTAAFDAPTSCIVRLGPASDPKNVTGVGFLVEPASFRPGFETPKDLRGYWDKELKKMRRLRPVVETFPAEGLEEQDETEFVCYKIEINMPSGRPCRGYVAYPRNAGVRSLPIYLFVHSAGVNKPDKRATAERAVSYAKMGCIALDINAHGFEDDMPQEYYDALDKGELHKYATRDFTGVQDYYFHNMYLRDVRALDYAVTLPQWDGKRILVRGTSQGGGQALALSGIDTRITHVVAIVPALTDLGGCLDGRKCGWPSALNRKFAPTPLGPSVLAYHDGATLVSLFKGDLHIEAGNIDMTCDPAAVAAAYNNANAVRSKQIFFFPWLPHTRMDLRNNADWREAVLKARDAFIEAAIKPSVR